MTGKPCKMHLDHGFDADKWVRESWVEDNLRATPKVIKWTRDYMFDRYSSDPRIFGDFSGWVGAEREKAFRVKAVGTV
jgi:hypothetical protein